jgi:hypothetical protein
MNMTVGSGWATPTNAIVRSTKRWAKSGKKGQKCHPRCLAFVTNNSGVGEEVESSNEEFVATAERDFKRHSRPPKGHFGMILEATYPHHPYHAKHKLRDCTMMRRFMTSGAPAGGNEPVRNSKGNGMALVPVEAEVVTITD